MVAALVRLVQHWGVDNAWGDAVDTDTAGSDFADGGAGEADYLEMG